MTSKIDRDSVVGVTTRYRLDGAGSNLDGDETFCTCPEWPWGPPSLLYNGYHVSFLGVKQSGGGIGHPSPPSAEDKE
jgi:hypothetical protein